MATYKEIFGTSVTNDSNNPDTPVEGQLWYNEADNALKLQTVSPSTGIWVSAASLNTGRNSGDGSGVTQDAVVVWGGAPDGVTPSAAFDKTESYNGTTWTELNDLNTGGSHRSPSNRGPVTASLAMSGRNSSSTTIKNVELWNGTCWSETTDVAVGRNKMSGAGISTSALLMGGSGDPTVSPNDHKFVESWNGSAWTEIADTVHNGGSSGAGGANNTTAVVFGGGPGPQQRTEIWNGSTWTEVNNMNVSKIQLPSHGIATAALRIGGRPPDSGDNTCESWNGTCWSSIANLNSLANFASAGGTSSLALRAMGPGGADGNGNVSEEWYASGQLFPKTIE